MSESIHDGSPSRSTHVCPVWIGHLLLNPLRKLVENPEAILAPLVRPGDVVLDVGCAMGYYSLPLARRVGEKGRVICLDIQPRMLQALKERAEREGLSSRLDTRCCGEAKLPLADVQGAVDLAVLVHVAHEVPDQARLFRELAGAVRAGGLVVFVEPRGHVSGKAFLESLRLADQAGFDTGGELPVRWARSRLLRRRTECS